MKDYREPQNLAANSQSLKELLLLFVQRVLRQELHTFQDGLKSSVVALQPGIKAVSHTFY